jgi:hypothetical protein
MAYTKQIWQNGEAGGTPISADRLNHMEAGIEQAGETASDALGTATSASAVAVDAADQADRAVDVADAARSTAQSATATATNALNTASGLSDAISHAQTAAETAHAAADRAQETANSALLIRHAEFSGRNNGSVNASTATPLAISAIPSATFNNDFCAPTSVASEIKFTKEGVYSIDFYAGLPRNVGSPSYIAIRNQDGSKSHAQLDLQSSSWGNSISIAGLYIPANTVLKFVFLSATSIVNAGSVSASIRITKLS